MGKFRLFAPIFQINIESILFGCEAIKTIVLGEMKIYLDSIAIIVLFEIMWTAGIQMK